MTTNQTTCPPSLLALATAAYDQAADAYYKAAEQTINTETTLREAEAEREALWAEYRRLKAPTAGEMSPEQKDRLNQTAALTNKIKLFKDTAAQLRATEQSLLVMAEASAARLHFLQKNS